MNNDHDIYADSDSEAQGEHYLRHIDRMTVEKLHSKSAIAGELAHRDEEIATLKAIVRAYVAYDESDHEDGVQMMLDYADMLKASRAALSTTSIHASNFAVVI